MGDKKIIDLGNIEGSVLLFGGIYSNWHALQALYEVCQAKGIPSSNVFHTGDVVAYGAFPNECIKFLSDWGCHSIVGNVEQQLVNGENHCACDFESGSRCDVLSNHWYPFLQKNISQQSLNSLKVLPDHLVFHFYNKKVSIVHGSVTFISEFIFESSPWEKKQVNFDYFEADIIVGGHCGIPFYQKKSSKTWINPGVIGMPANDGNHRTWFAIMSKSQDRIDCTFHQLEYDYKGAAGAMVEKALPLPYANTIETGLWDNMEILPFAEKQLQGISYHFPIVQL